MPSRRAFLAVTGGTALAGCTALSGDGDAESPYSPGSERTDWRTTGSDPTGTGYVAEAAAPRSEPEVRWTTDAVDADTLRGYRQPLVAGDTVVLPWAGGVTAHDLATGDRRWAASGNAHGRAHLGDDTVYTTVGDVGSFAALSLPEGDRRWTVETPEPVVTSPVPGARDDELFAGAATGRLYQLHADGEGVGHRRELFGRPGAVAFDGGPFVGTEAGEVYAFLGARDGGERWRRKLVGGVTDVAATGDTLFVATDQGRAYRLAVRETGRTVWSRDAGALVGRLAATRHHVVHVRRGSGLAVLDAADGDRVWADAGEWYAGPVAAGDTLYVGGEPGVVAYALAEETRRWQFETDSPVAALSVADGAVLAVTADGTLRALE